MHDSTILYQNPDDSTIVLEQGSRGFTGATGATGATGQIGLTGQSSNQMSVLKRWHQQFAQAREGLVSGTPYSTDVIWVGDSIGEGYSSSNSTTTMVNVFTDNLSRMANPDGRGGRWVPAGGDWLTYPKFTDQDSSLLGTHTITAGAFPGNQVFLNENFATSIFPASGDATIYGLYVGVASISYTGKTNNAGKTVLTGVTIISSYFLSPPNTTFGSGTSVYFGGDDLVRRGFSLRSRNLLPIAGQNIGATATLEFTGDNVIVYYRKVNFLVGYIGFKLYLKDSSSVYQLIHTSSPIFTYTSAGSLYTQELHAWNAETDYSGTLSRGDYKLEVYNYASNPSATNYFVSFDGAYVCDGNTSQGVKVWNSSLSGATFASFNNIVDTVYNSDWLSALRDGLVNPSLVVIAIGTNESANPGSIEASLIAMVNSVNAAYAVGFPGEPMPSFAFFVPPADSTTISSQWDLVRNTYASVASSVGAALWNWAEFTGDVNHASSPTNGTGDPYGWTTDSIHPSTAGHRAIGDFITSQALLGINAKTEKIDASLLTSGTITASRLPSAATTITSLGTLTGLTIDGPISSSMTFGDLLGPDPSGIGSIVTPLFSGIQGNIGHLLLGKNALDDYNIYLRNNNSVGGVIIGANNTNIMSVGTTGMTLTGLAYVGGSSTIGTQSDVSGRFSTSSGVAGLLLGSLSGTAPFVGTGGAYPLTLNTNGVARVHISSTGSAVIGHTAPVLITAGVQPNLQILGNTVPTSSLMQVRYNNDTSGPSIYLGHSRSTTIGGHTTVATNDGLGNLQFVGSDGTNFISSASISGGAEGTISTGVVPGRLIFSTANSSGTLTERMRIDSTGRVAIGTTPSAGYSFFLANPITGLPTSYGFVSAGTVQSDVTSGVNQFITGGNTAAAAFTLGSFNHFAANGVATPGAGSTITTQNGFYVFGTTTGALNNFAFRGLIPTGANNNWNLYMDGTAPNYMLGRLAIGNTTGGAMLRVQNDTAGNATVVLRNAAAQSGPSLQIVDSAGAQFFGIGTTGNVGIGTVLSAGAILRINKPITGSTVPSGYYITSAVDGDFAGLTSGIGYFSAITASGSTAVPDLTHFLIFGGTSTTKPTVQNGFVVNSNMTDGVSNRGFVGQLAAATDRWNLYMSGSAQNYLAGNLGIGVTVPTSKLHVVGSFSRGAPVTISAVTHTVVDTNNWLICTNNTATTTITLPTASNQVGREITIKTTVAFTVVSASANVVPQAGGAAATAILPATAGSWAKLVSDGANWIIMQS